MDRFILHHIDNNPENNPEDCSNWMLVCKSCNTTYHPRGPSKRGIRMRHKLHCLNKNTNENEYENESENINNIVHNEKDLVVRVSAELAKHEECVPRFNKFIETVISVSKTVKVKDLIDGAAYELNISQQTARRYLDCASNPINGKYSYYIGEDSEKWLKLRT